MNLVMAVRQNIHVKITVMARNDTAESSHAGDSGRNGLSANGDDMWTPSPPVRSGFLVEGQA